MQKKGWIPVPERKLAFAYYVVEMPCEETTSAMFYIYNHDAGEMCGFAKVDMWGENKTAFLSYFHIEESWRESGLGGAFLDYIIQTARGIKAAAVTMYVHKDNDIAMSLYKSRDFVPVCGGLSQPSASFGASTC